MYLTWGEVVVTSGIFRNLICEQIHQSEKHYGHTLHVYSGIPLVNKTLLFDRKKWKSEVQDTKKMLGSTTFCMKMIPVPASFFYATFLAQPLMHSFGILGLLRYIRENDIRIIHCRSYHATCVALFARRVLRRRNIKVIFDTRGTVPEEGVVFGKYPYGGISYKRWKNLEKNCLDRADYIVNISEQFSEYVHSLTDNKKVASIYASINTEYFALQPDKSALREKWGIGRDARILAYSGAFSENGYHDPVYIASVYREAQKASPDLKLLILSKANADYVLGCLVKLGLREDDVIIREGKTPQDVAEILECCDVSVFPFKKVYTYPDKLMAETMIGSKVPEYLAAGLPVFCNKGVVGVARLITERGLGLSFDPDNVDGFSDSVRSLFGKLDSVTVNCRNAAREIFNADKAGQQYATIYEELERGMTGTQ
jgi:glycosyltransferase involved in cell wall biosynthesis